MLFRFLADAVVWIHVAFVCFVILGGFLVLRRPRWLWLHLPAVAWGAWVELSAGVCPLTPLENWLRRKGGGQAYTTTFVERYVEPVLYPPSLTLEMQWVFGGIVVAVNLAVYLWFWRRRRARRG